MSTTPEVIHRDPDILGGMPVFAGTRVPLRTMLDYLEAGDSLDVFLDDFPSVTREQVVAAFQSCPPVSPMTCPETNPAPGDNR